MNLRVATEPMQGLSPSLAADAQLADDSASPPDSPEIYYSQYRLAKHEENKTAVCQRCASPEVAAEADRYPTPPGAPDDDVLSSYTDLFCEATLPTISAPSRPRASHSWSAKKDIMSACRLKFHLKRFC